MTVASAPGTPVGEPQPFTPCPQCAFGNPRSERTCLFCAAALPFDDATRKISRRLVEVALEAARASAGAPPPIVAAAPVEPPPAAAQGGTPERPGIASSRLRRIEGATPVEPLAFLCCRPLPPLPLGPVPIVTIGRSADCHVVLPHLEVSRHHCSIKVRRQNLVLEDEGSSNGTLVNERRAASADLKVGDVITVGPYVMEVLDEERATAWEAEDDHAEPAIDISHAMSGRIDEVPLTEVLQGLEFNKRTGTLQVAAGRQRGQVVVEEGRPLSAAFQSLRDDRAIIAMLALDAGRFSFVRTPDCGPRRMSGVTITGLLLEASRRQDEGQPAGTSSDCGPAGTLQVEGGKLAPAIGSVGPAPRAARLSPAMRAPTEPEAATPADTAKAAPLDDAAPEPASSRLADPARREDPATARHQLPTRTPPEVEPEPEPEPPPTPTPTPLLVVAPTSRAPGAPWVLVALLALACVALAWRLALRPPAVDQGQVLAAVQALRTDVEQALSSPRSLLADAPAIAQLRGRVTALRGVAADDKALATADAGVSALEGLLAAARGDAAGASVALGRSTGAGLPAATSSALLGASIVAGAPGDRAAAVEHLSLAIEGGVLRPELRSWRARLRAEHELVDVGRAAVILDDLRIVAGTLGLSRDEELLRARALLVLGRDDEAGPLLEELRARQGAAALEVTLALVEQALARGEVRRAVVLVQTAPGDPSAAPQARDLTTRARRSADPLLDDLRRGFLLSGGNLTRLLDLLRLTRVLGGAPLDDAEVAPLLEALDRPGERLSPELCLGVAEVAGRDSLALRRRVLTRIYRAMEDGTETKREANLTLLLCFVVGAEPRGVAHLGDLLATVRARPVLTELYHARALAREQLGRVRDALLDAERALRLEPAREDLNALRDRLTEAAKALPPAPPKRGPRRVG